MPAVEIEVLGPLRVSVAGHQVDLPGGRLPVLLAVLAMSAGQVVSVDRLATAVWGAAVAVDVRPNVQSNVKRLRRLLGADVIATRGVGYALDVDPDHVDALRFVRLLDGAAAARDEATERALLDGAIALWRGSPFDGMRSEWLEQTQTVRLQERYLTALERRVDLRLAGGSQAELGDALGELRELTGSHPLRESLWSRLLIVLQRLRRPAEALERYEAVRIRLADELGADPGPELQRIHADLLTDTPPGAPAPRERVPRLLPADTDAFTGRDDVLAALDELVDRLDEPSRTVAISTIVGAAGIGKTALAVHWAHRVAARFPDGQLYVNLRGFDPGAAPVAPADALRLFLDALEVPPQRIPASIDAQAGLYRSLLAGTRMLVVLDNARDIGQVAPLLPGASGCLVLVTSRNELPGLSTAHGARPLNLGVLAPDEAEQMLVRQVGAARSAAEPGATAELIDRCAGLPLALAIVAARAAARPEFPLAALADQLRDSRDDLDAFDAGDSASSVRAVFSWSYDDLSAETVRLFRLLGLHPGPDVTVPAAAALAGRPAAEVRRRLAELSRAHLIIEHAPGRYAFHDLLRAYAREATRTHDTDAERRDATHRLLDHLVHTAHAADQHLFEHGETLELLPSGVPPEPVRDQSHALAWFQAERRVLLAAMQLPSPRHSYLLACTLFVFLHRQGYWSERVATQHAALDAARQLDDLPAQARAHRYLGSAYADLERFDDGHLHLDLALALAEDAGDLVGQAWTHHYRDLVHGMQGHDEQALESAEQALRLFSELQHRNGMAVALTDVGWYHGRLGNLDEALSFGTKALAEHRELGNRSYEAHTLSCLVDTHRRRGEDGAATDCEIQALAVFRELGDRFGEASALAVLGELYGRSGDVRAALGAWEQAREILADLDPAAAESIRAHLRGLDLPV